MRRNGVSAVLLLLLLLKVRWYATGRRSVSDDRRRLRHGTHRTATRPVMNVVVAVMSDRFGFLGRFVTNDSANDKNTK